MSAGSASTPRTPSICAFNAAADLAETSHGIDPDSPAPWGDSPPIPIVSDGTDSSGVVAYCSKITWAFVPLMPNDETAQRRARPVSGH